MPEDWVRLDKVIKQGTFKFKDNNVVPPVLSNVKLFKGLFNDVLPQYVKQYLMSQPIALLHVDCDLYSATKEALQAFKHNIVPGTIIVFDEFYNYPGSEQHEYKALNEFLNEMNYSVKYLAFNAMHEQVVVEIIPK